MIALIVAKCHDNTILTFHSLVQFCLVLKLAFFLSNDIHYSHQSAIFFLLEKSYFIAEGFNKFYATLAHACYVMCFVDFNYPQSTLQKGQFFYKEEDRKSTRLNSSHSQQSRMPSSA